MEAVTVHEAKTNLSKLLVDVETTGEEIIIARRDKPVARLVPIKKQKIDRSGLVGCLDGLVSEEAVDYLTDPKLDKQIANNFLRSSGKDEEE